jgi:hypothetical protein
MDAASAYIVEKQIKMEKKTQAISGRTRPQKSDCKYFVLPS